MNNPLVVFLLLNIFNTAIMIEKTILYIKVILSILYGYPNFEIKKILRFLSRFGADAQHLHSVTRYFKPFLLNIVVKIHKS